MRRRRISLAILALVAVVVAPASAREPLLASGENRGIAPPAAIWRDPGDVARLDLSYGAGGKAHAPDPNGRYTFLEPDLSGHSPKFLVEDEQGVLWKVKLGPESKSETAATRLLWAAGFFVDEDYYVEEIRVSGLPSLPAIRPYVSPEGSVFGARLERLGHEQKKVGDWEWFDNPFVGTRELNALRVMMCAVSNWDLAAGNNAIYEVDGEQRYLVHDVGASFGRSGNELKRSKSTVDDYIRSPFIRKRSGDTVDLVMECRPIFLGVVLPPNYRKRTRMEGVGEDIPVADAVWVGRRLGRLSERQIRDCFRAAGYTPAEVEGYTHAFLRRIAELNAL